MNGFISVLASTLAIVGSGVVLLLPNTALAQYPNTRQLSTPNELATEADNYNLGRLENNQEISSDPSLGRGGPFSDENIAGYGVSNDNLYNNEESRVDYEANQHGLYLHNLDVRQK